MMEDKKLNGSSQRLASWRFAALSGCAMLALASTPALAQTAPVPAQADAEDVSPEDGNEIIVTARARDERLQDVPLAITALSSEALQDNNVRNLRDIAYLTPGLNVTSAGSEFAVNPTIRGQTNLNAGSGDPNVAVFFDGIYISNSTAINIGLVDIARVEVVKGPVSALYGRNAFGGAINYVSKRPSTTDMSGSVTGFIGNDEQYSLSGSISVPVIQGVLGVRIAAGYEHFAGSYTDRVTGATAGGFEKRDAQISVLFTPSDAFTLSAGYYHGDDVFGQSAIIYNVNNCGFRNTSAAALAQDPNGTGLTAFCGHFDPDQREAEVAILPKNSGTSGNDRKVDFASLNMSYDFGFAKLISLTGYTKVDQQRFIDFIGRRNGIPFLLSPGPGTVNLIELFGSETNNEDFSQEFRLQSEAAKRFRWQLGGFYFKSSKFDQTIIGLDSSQLPAGQTLLPGLPRNSLTPPGTLSSLIRGQVRSHDKQYSGFVGLEFDVTERLTVSGEYRQTHQKKDQLVIRNTGCPGNLTAPTASCTGPAPTPYLFPNGPDPVRGTFNFDNYRATLKYQVSDGTNFYASIANGTKAGGFNQRAIRDVDGSQPDLQFDPEENITYEIGMKNSFFNNRLQLNLAAYHIDIDGIQISGPSAVPTNPGTVTKNFGSVHTNGFEIELAARVAEGVRVSTGIAYSDPKFGSDAFDFLAGTACLSIPACSGRVIVATPGSPLNPVVTLPSGAPNTSKNVLKLDGLSAPRQPDWQLNFGLDLNGAINDDWSWSANLTARYESKQFAFNNNISWYGPRTVMNARIGVENDTFSVSLYANNLTDDKTPEAINLNARLSDFGSDAIGLAPIGRQYGLIVGAKF
jgi:iron complex outermembrane recepter protein